MIFLKKLTTVIYLILGIIAVFEAFTLSLGLPAFNITIGIIGLFVISIAFDSLDKINGYGKYRINKPQGTNNTDKTNDDDSNQTNQTTLDNKIDN